MFHQPIEDDDYTHWIFPMGLWSLGACIGWLTVCWFASPAVHNWIAVVAAICVSVISIGLQLPPLLAQRQPPLSIVHSQWLLGLLAQISWTGFLATRVSDSLAAAVVIAICVGSQVWLTGIFRRWGKLPWLSLNIEEEGALFNDRKDVSKLESQLRVFDTGRNEPENSVSGRDQPDARDDDQALADGQIVRRYVDGIDAQGVRYMSGQLVVAMEADQRSEVVAISFFPALDGVAELDLECDADEVSLNIEQASECGARITLRRHGDFPQASYVIDWYATAGQDASMTKKSLP